MDKNNENHLVIEELNWSQARQRAIKSCKNLLNIIDQIDPPPNLKLIKVRYPFGSTIVKDDVLYLPTDDSYSVPITDSSIDPRNGS